MKAALRKSTKQDILVNFKRLLALKASGLFVYEVEVCQALQGFNTFCLSFSSDGLSDIA
jgi:hypothetical protein